MDDEGKIDTLLKRLLREGRDVPVTQNKTRLGRKNFYPLRGKPGEFHDGEWTGQPDKTREIGWGIHFEKAIGETGGRIWAGRWRTPKWSTKKGRWIFHLSEVEGPFTTARPFLELFGIASQAPFVYLRSATATQTSAAVARAAAKVPSKREGRANASAKLPLTGEDVAVLGKRRLGHGQLKKAVHQHFSHRCCMTGIETPALLVCSHIIPWAKSTRETKVSLANTLLLAANWDAAFDLGLIGFSSTGLVVKSPALTEDDALKLGLKLNSRLPPKFLKPRLTFLKYHCKNRMLDKNGRRKEL